MKVNVEDVLKEFPQIELEGLDEGDIVTDLIVIARSQGLDSSDDSILIAISDNTGGVTAHGMLTSAVVLHTGWMVAGLGGTDEQ